MAEFSARAPGRDGRLRQVAAWIGAAVVYGAAQGLSAWVARYAQGRGTRPRYEQFKRPAFAPPGAVFPVVLPSVNSDPSWLTPSVEATATRLTLDTADMRRPEPIAGTASGRATAKKRCRPE